MAMSPSKAVSPSKEELVAIVAAVELQWPKAVVMEEQPDQEDTQARWRFSGRWWVKPIPSRRDRPWS
jgi:hypothetical protein